MSLSELLTAAIQLPANERGQLVHQLLASFEEGEDSGVEGAWAAELAARAERLLKGETRGRPLAEVCDELQTKLTR